MKLNGLMAFVLFSIIMLVLDAVYLNIIAGEFGKMIGKIQGSKMELNVGAAAVVYIALVSAWYTFIYPDIGKRDLKYVLCRAFVLGVCIYATYDFTNLALIKDYRLDLAVMDSVWGGLLYATSTYLYVFISSLV